mgnify:CR=1 FL=1
MRDLKYIIQRCFEGYLQDAICSPRNNVIHNFQYMNVPIFKDVFELPVFMIGRMSNCNLPVTSDEVDSFTACLNYIGTESTYKTLSSKMRAILINVFNKARLVKIPLDTQGENYYYGTCGAIFNKNLMPVMMMSWRIEKVKRDNTDTLFVYKFTQPILRVSPSVFTVKANPLTRYIINQIIPNALRNRYDAPHIYSNPLFPSTHESFNIKVDIGEFPFTLQKVNAPSVSTTNEELLHVALDHIDEVVQ